MLPKKLERAKAPPIKCQGIKTKLAPFIFRTVAWNGEGRWVEPFLGSGVLLFNLAPENVVAADANEHIINVYRAIQKRKITPASTRKFLEREGEILREKGEDHYYYIRDRFNAEQDPLDFLFLNRSCFNGMMRFNQSGGFNVPFCRKPNRFRQAYVTKICNQIKWAYNRMCGKDWTFVAQDWRETLEQTGPNDFVYLDPPYVGRHSTYYNAWDEKEADELASTVKELDCGFAYSMWKSNEYRENEHLEHFKDYPVVTKNHFYHVGSTEDLRNEMEEAVVVAPSSVAEESTQQPTGQAELEL